MTTMKLLGHFLKSRGIISDTTDLIEDTRLIVPAHTLKDFGELCVEQSNYVIECISVPGEAMHFTMPDNKKVSIRHYAVDLVEKLRKLPVDYRLTILGIDEAEIEKYYNSIKDNKSEKVKAILDGKWMWRETGEEYDFNDEDSNFEVLGVRLTKKQINGKLKRNTMDSAELIKIIDTFNRQEELIEV